MTKTVVGYALRTVSAAAGNKPHLFKPKDWMLPGKLSSVSFCRSNLYSLLCAEDQFLGSEEIRNVDDDIVMMHQQYVEYQEQWEQVRWKYRLLKVKARQNQSRDMW